jgi:hypothetical protein
MDIEIPSIMHEIRDKIKKIRSQGNLQSETGLLLLVGERWQGLGTEMLPYLN